MTDDIFVPGTIIGTKSRYLQVCYIILFPIDEHRVMTLNWHGKLINTACWVCEADLQQVGSEREVWRPE